jgi:hypothetical protein
MVAKVFLGQMNSSDNFKMKRFVPQSNTAHQKNLP